VLTVTGIGAQDKVYDGTTAATLTGTPGTLVGVLSGDTVTLGSTAVGTFADPNIGANKTVTVSGQTLGGPSAGNYTLMEPTATASITGACSQTNAIVGIAENQDGTFTLTFIGTLHAQYYVVASPDPTAPMTNWVPLPDSTNTVTDSSGLWQLTVPSSGSQQYYRSTAVMPCP
jgi:hypothetical protein